MSSAPSSKGRSRFSTRATWAFTAARAAWPSSWIEQGVQQTTRKPSALQVAAGLGRAGLQLAARGGQEVRVDADEDDRAIGDPAGQAVDARAADRDVDRHAGAGLGVGQAHVAPDSWWGPSRRRPGPESGSRPARERRAGAGFLPSVSTELSPVPMPSRARPPISSCRVAMRRGDDGGSRVIGLVTPVASVIRDVAIAAAPRMT